MLPVRGGHASVFCIIPLFYLIFIVTFPPGVIRMNFIALLLLIISGAAFRTIGLTKISKIELLPLDWIYRSIRNLTVFSVIICWVGEPYHFSQNIKYSIVPILHSKGSPIIAKSADSVQWSCNFCSIFNLEPLLGTDSEAVTETTWQMINGIWKNELSSTQEYLHQKPYADKETACESSSSVSKLFTLN